MIQACEANSYEFVIPGKGSGHHCLPQHWVPETSWPVGFLPATSSTSLLATQVSLNMIGASLSSEAKLLAGLGLPMQVKLPGLSSFRIIQVCRGSMHIETLA